MSSISVQSFITDVMATVDHVIGHYVQTCFTHLVQNNSEVITLAMTVYVMGYGYRALHHKVSTDISAITLHLVSLLTVYGLLMNWELFDLFFYQVFTNEPNEIIKTMLEANGNGQGQQAPNEALNAVFNAGMQAADRLFIIYDASILHNWVYGIYGALVWTMTFCSCIYALALLVYAKLALAVVLSLAPLFILCLLWSSTRGFFERWLHVLVNYALIPIITCGLLMLTLSISQVTLPDLAQATQTNDGGVSGILPYLGLCLLNILLLKQVLPTCASLCGGFALESVGHVLPWLQKAVQTIGLDKATKKIVGHTMNSLHRRR